MERSTSSYTHMGGEGANWIGLSRYSTSDHVFQNLGDGTYFHSGSLAIRAAIAAGVNITYKILFNDAVAMTGGQAMDGELTVDRVTVQVAAEGAARVVIVSDDPDQYPAGTFGKGVALHPRADLAQIPSMLRAAAGVHHLLHHPTRHPAPPPPPHPA